MQRHQKADGRFRPLASVPGPWLATGITLATALHAGAEIEDTLDDLIVSAWRMPADATRITSSVTSLDPGDLEDRGILDLKSALNEVPGVISTSTAAQTGGVGSLFIRGTTTAYSQVLVDGIRVSDSTAPLGNFLSGARVDDFDRIEVLRGPHSAIHGGEAVGGVIWLETDHGEVAPSTRLRAEAGSFDTLGTHASTQGRAGAFSWFAALGHDTTANDAQLQRYDQSRGALRAEWRQSDALTLGVTFRANDSRFDYPAFGANTDHLDSQLGTVYAKASLAPGWDARFTVGHYRENYDNENFGFFGASNYGTDLDRTSVSTDHSVALGDCYTLLWGAFFEHTDFRNSIGTDLGRNRYGGYTGLAWKPLDSLSADAVIRWEDYAAYGDEITWRTGAAWQAPRIGTIFRGGIGRAFRAPTYLDLYGTAFGAGNPNLEAEDSIGWDFGIEQEIAGDHRLSLTWFENSIENRIRSFPTPPVNLPGETPARGLETAIAGSWCDGAWRYRIAWTYLDASLADQPDHTANASLTWKPAEKWLLGIGASYVDDRSWGGLPMEDYFLVRLHGSYQATEQLRLHARVENLFDSSYQLANFAGSPPIEGAGLGFFGGMTLDF
ncbi:TonB-dependent receptor plug domain-containing protein [Luteolibacter marinus]|uniref:TonB-dependent receptor plug domain-containing protein n=1 Tax=Luteolibacter marinus TaxID=2776705 RepID=UPI00186870AE|nr:TonB-dependent receptor [Luteolibacter marinus]